MSLLRNLDCITDDGKFTNAGVLFFARDIDFLLNHAFVVCVLYRGTEKVNILDKKDFKGSMVENINNATAIPVLNKNTCGRRLNFLIFRNNFISLSTCIEYES
jgi:predicted HTH transcriptional regulator